MFFHIMLKDKTLQIYIFNDVASKEEKQEVLQRSWMYTALHFSQDIKALFSSIPFFLTQHTLSLSQLLGPLNNSDQKNNNVVTFYY